MAKVSPKDATDGRNAVRAILCHAHIGLIDYERELLLSQYIEYFSRGCHFRQGRGCIRGRKVRDHASESLFKRREVGSELIDQPQVKGYKEVNSEDTPRRVSSERCQREQMSIFSTKTEVLMQAASPAALVFEGNQYLQKGFYLGSLIFPVEGSIYSGISQPCWQTGDSLQDPERDAGTDGEG